MCREFCFLTNPDLADIWGRTDFGFEIFFAFLCVCFWGSTISRVNDFQVPDFQTPGLGFGWACVGFSRTRLRPGLGLGRAMARPLPYSTGFPWWPMAASCPVWDHALVSFSMSCISCNHTNQYNGSSLLRELLCHSCTIGPN